MVKRTFVAFTASAAIVASLGLAACGGQTTSEEEAVVEEAVTEVVTEAAQSIVSWEGALADGTLVDYVSNDDGTQGSFVLTKQDGKETKRWIGAMTISDDGVVTITDDNSKESVTFALVGLSEDGAVVIDVEGYGKGALVPMTDEDWQMVNEAEKLAKELGTEVGKVGAFEDGSLMAYAETSDGSKAVVAVWQKGSDEIKAWAGEVATDADGKRTVTDAESGEAISYTWTENGEDGSVTVEADGYGKATLSKLTVADGIALEAAMEAASIEAEETLISWQGALTDGTLVDYISSKDGKNGGLVLTKDEKSEPTRWVGAMTIDDNGKVTITDDNSKESVSFTIEGVSSEGAVVIDVDGYGKGALVPMSAADWARVGEAEELAKELGTEIGSLGAFEDGSLIAYTETSDGSKAVVAVWKKGSDEIKTWAGDATTADDGTETVTDAESGETFSYTWSKNDEDGTMTIEADGYGKGKAVSLTAADGITLTAALEEASEQLAAAAEQTLVSWEGALADGTLVDYISSEKGDQGGLVLTKTDGTELAKWVGAMTADDNGKVTITDDTSKETVTFAIAGIADDGTVVIDVEGYGKGALVPMTAADWARVAEAEEMAKTLGTEIGSVGAFEDGSLIAYAETSDGSKAIVAVWPKDAKEPKAWAGDATTADDGKKTVTDAESGETFSYTWTENTEDGTVTIEADGYGKATLAKLTVADGAALAAAAAELLL